MKKRVYFSYYIDIELADGEDLNQKILETNFDSDGVFTLEAVEDRE